MKSGDPTPEKGRILTVDEVLRSLEAWKAEKTKFIKFLLVKDCGLQPNVDFSFETKGGHQVHVVHISDRGLQATYDIGPNTIQLRTKTSLNDTEMPAVEWQEGEIINEHIAALQDYFSTYPDDRPEYEYQY